MYYRKKPIVIEAFHWVGLPQQEADPQWIIDSFKSGTMFFDYTHEHKMVMKIITLEGIMTASRNDYIIKGVKGEIYPCKPDIFEATYELAE